MLPLSIEMSSTKPTSWPVSCWIFLDDRRSEFERERVENLFNDFVEGDVDAEDTLRAWPGAKLARAGIGGVGGVGTLKSICDVDMERRLLSLRDERGGIAGRGLFAYILRIFAVALSRASFGGEGNSAMILGIESMNVTVAMAAGLGQTGDFV